MPDLSALVLVGLAVVIFVYFWWLHRRSDLDSLHVVPSIDLWDEHPSQTSGRASQQHRLWWLVRAMLCCCILAALAGLKWPGDAAPETVWVDATPSLETKEANGDRALLAAQAIYAALQQTGARQVRLRSAQDANVSTGVLNNSAGTIAEGLRDLVARSQAGPPNGIPDKARWIFTDGAAHSPAAWTKWSTATVISAGSETENTGITALSARLSLLDPGTFTVLVEARNAGLRPATRTVTLSRGTEGPQSREITLNPGEVHWVSFDVPVADEGTLKAELTPPDALHSDDTLVLLLHETDLLSRVWLAPTCGTGLRGAIVAMNRIQLAGSPADLMIDCGPKPDQTAALRIWTGNGGPVSPPVSWTQAADNDLRRVPVSSMDFTAIDPGPAFDTRITILQAMGKTLVAKGPIGVDVFADLTHPDVQRDLWFPILLRGLINLSGDGGAKTYHQITRSSGFIAVAPAPVARGANLPPAPLGEQHPLTWLFILLAAGLVIADTIKVRRYEAG